MRERDKEDKISSWMAIYYDNEAKKKCANLCLLRFRVIYTRSCVSLSLFSGGYYRHQCEIIQIISGDNQSLI